MSDFTISAPTAGVVTITVELNDGWRFALNPVGEAGAITIADDLIEQREIFNAAEIYNLCGETEKVFQLLQQAVKDRDPALTEMKLSWAMNNLRDDPRWKEILKEMGLPA